MKKIILITIGCIGVGLGAVGAVLPLLPAFPFLLLAAVCFGKSSEKLERRIKNSKLYKNNVEGIVSGKGMDIRAKVRVMLTITALMSIGFFMMSDVLIGRIILFVVWVFHILYFVFGIKTVKK